ncbi:MAG: 3'-5' exonuclease, partial [Patescibacteria group bacterium]
HNNICAVGDTDQNIYSWRGADMSNMMRFEKDYPESTIILLEENYRSTQTILAAANSVIKKNKVRIEKNLFTKNVTGEKIGVFEGWSEAEEAFFVTNKVKELQKKGVALREMSVLYRANFQSRVLEEAFAAEGLPYAMVGTKFFERKEIKDTLAFIRAALNGGAPGDVERIINVPPRGIGDKTLEKIWAGQTAALSATLRAKVENFYALLERIKVVAQTQTPTETIRFVLKESGMENLLEHGSEQDKERLENARELLTLAKRYDREPIGEGIELLIADASLAAAEETPGEVASDAVRLMTVHAAKGLEFDYVFVTGLEEGLFPHERSSSRGDSSQEAEEERRLFYVALTRARHKVFLSYATMRTIFGERRTTLPSRFLSDVPPEHTEMEFVTKPRDGGRPLKTIYF